MKSRALRSRSIVFEDEKKSAQKYQIPDSGLSSGYSSGNFEEMEKHIPISYISDIEIINLTPIEENCVNIEALISNFPNFSNNSIGDAKVPKVSEDEDMSDCDSSENYDDDDDDPDWAPENHRKNKISHTDSDESKSEGILIIDMPKIKFAPKNPKERKLSKKYKTSKSKFYFQLTEDHLKIVNIAMSYSHGKNHSRMEMWQFLLFLLHHSHHIDMGLSWTDEENNVFRINNAKKLATLWGMHQKNENMTYESMSRNLRHYYTSNILKKHTERLSYQFSQSSSDWYKNNFKCE